MLLLIDENNSYQGQLKKLWYFKDYFKTSDSFLLTVVFSWSTFVPPKFPCFIVLYTVKLSSEWKMVIHRKTFAYRLILPINNAID